VKYKLKNIFYKIHSFIPFYLVLILVLIDFTVRSNIIFNYNFIEWLIYVNSVLFINELVKVFLKLSFNKVRRRIVPFFIATIVIVITILLLTIISYSVFSYFGLLPNKGIISYVFNEPSSSWIFVKEYIQLWHILLVVLLISIVPFILMKYSKELLLTRKNLLTNLGISLVTLISILSIVQKFDQCGLPVSQTITSSLDFFLINGSEKKTKTLVKTGNMKIPTIDKAADFNIILIINESVRRKSMQIYNSSLKTTPHLLEFKEKHKNNFYQFEWARTNATLTFLSVPSILNGLSPYANKNLWLAAPLLWDYAKAAKLETFLVSAHCFNWGGWKNYLLQSKNLDYYYTECQFTNTKYNGNNHPLGISDDSIFIKKFVSHVDSVIRAKMNFFGVLHLYGTHAPYWFKEENRLSEDLSRQNDYNSSIYQQDVSLNILFEYLEDKNLVDNTVILYTSDHGEAFGERNVSGHLTRYFEEVVGIPMWIYIPPKLSEYYDEFNLKNNLKKNVANIDILPTVLDLLKIPTIPELYKKDGGLSFLKVIPKKRKILVTNYNNINYTRFDKSYCVISDSMKYMYLSQNGKLDVSVFNFITDKKEKDNLNKNNKNIVKVNYALLKSL